MEESALRRSPDCISGSSESHPPNEPRQPSSHSWGTSETRYSGVADNSCQVHGPAPETSLPVVANLSQESRQGPKDSVSADFFVVPTIAFQLLFVFVILDHDRRRPIHFAVTSKPHGRMDSPSIFGQCPALLVARPGRRVRRERSFTRRNAWAFEKSWLRRDHRGKIPLLSDWWAPSGANAWITSFTRANLPDRSGLPNARVKMQNEPLAMRSLAAAFLWKPARGLTLDATGMEYGSHR
jgi:hypothetical protein